jgi:hypothetical protein
MNFKVLVATAAVLAAVVLAAQSGDTFKARLSAVASDAKTRPDLAGVGNATATISGTKLTVNGTFDGLKSAATTAKLHNAVAAGVRGPAMQDLTITKATSGSISGSADLTPEQMEHLRKGGIYIQIYTEKAPDGALWGWLVR